MRIVILKSFIDAAGGLEKNTWRIAKAFAACGHEVVLLTTGTHSFFTADGIEVVNVAERSRLSFFHMIDFDRKCKRWLQKNPSQVVFGMDRNSCQTHYRAGNGVHAQYLKQRSRIEPWYKRLSFGCNPLHRVILDYERIAFQSPSLRLLFTNSLMVRQEILERYEIEEEKVCVVHNGVEWGEFAAVFLQRESLGAQVKKEQGLDTGAFQFLFVGSGFKRKGLDYLLKALALLDRKDVQLTVVGKDKGMDEYALLAKKLGLSQQTFFVGVQKNVLPYYAMADCCVIPSIYDPFANVTLESLAMGLPVLTSRFNGGAEVVESLSGSVIEDLFSVDSFVDALQRMIKEPKTVVRAQKIRDSVEVYSYDKQMKKIIDNTLQTVP
ncbi:glycosyltransferase family 4 protein [Simkania negevensis]|uniref:Glycosyltransferase family 4 protein n=1 Tax=Simkania negevensis TaxID=83561 RepID=A0ABS3ARX1_9BACT|nr:glycosyltransferase family 4 protein [Simkania negevensis]